MKPTIAYIPGFNSTTTAFSFIKASLPVHEAIPINYDTHQPLKKSIQFVSSKIPANKPVFIVAHSLGGIIATHTASFKNHDIAGIITISTPFGGSKAAWIMRWIMRSSVMGDITPDAYHIRKINSIELPPTKSIISTSGSIPTALEKNDSVVTINSQLHLKNSEKHFINANHFEVLQHSRTVDIIKETIWG